VYTLVDVLFTSASGKALGLHDLLLNLITVNLALGAARRSSRLKVARKDYTDLRLEYLTGTDDVVWDAWLLAACSWL
jgi:hypothetical protein